MAPCSNSLPPLNRHLFAFACVFVCLPRACVFVAFDIDQGGNRRRGTRGFQTPPSCSLLSETALEFSLLFSAMRQRGEFGLLCTQSHKELNASLQGLQGINHPIVFSFVLLGEVSECEFYTHLVKACYNKEQLYAFTTRKTIHQSNEPSASTLESTRVSSEALFNNNTCTTVDVPSLKSTPIEKQHYAKQQK